MKNGKQSQIKRRRWVTITKFNIYWDNQSVQKVCHVTSMFRCWLVRESKSEFQRTLPEYTRLELKKSFLGIGILNF